MGIIFAILLFTILIFVHELGHFLAAKASGVQVNEFSLFMGPAIFKKQIGETLYAIRLIPIGGYCAMEGEDSDTDNPRSFQKAAWWKRIIVLISGAAMNFLVGLLIIAIVLSFSPYYASTQVSQVYDWCSANVEGGLMAGDTIVQFNGKAVRIAEDFTLNALMLPDGNYNITVRRDGKLVQLQDVPMIRRPVEYEDGTKDMKYGFNFTTVETTAASVPGRILPTAMNYVDSVVMSLKMLLGGNAGLKDMSGPVGIVKLMSDTAQASDTAQYAVLNLLTIGGLIAINLAVMNLLPFPALDGGRVVCLLITTVIEAVTRKKLDPKYEGYFHAAGMLLLLALMAVITFKDIFTIFS